MPQIKSVRFLLLFLVVFGASQAKSTIFRVNAATGSPGNDGINQPWDLQTAFSHPAAVQPGDTIIVEGGATYTGVFTSTLTGAPGNPIIVMGTAGNLPRIENPNFSGSGGVVNVYGEWTYYQQLFVRGTHPDRGPHGSNVFRQMGFDVHGDHLKFIHNYVADAGHGFGVWADAADVELYGNLIFNCGTQNIHGQYLTHGHGIYSQNDLGFKSMRDNVIFNNFGFGLHVYPNPGGIVNYVIEGNVIFNSGMLTDTSKGLNNLLVDGYAPWNADSLFVRENHLFQRLNLPQSTHWSAMNLNLGLPDMLDHGLAEVRENYFTGGTPVAYLYRFRKIKNKLNHFTGREGLLGMQTALSNPQPAEVDSNVYHSAGDTLMGFNGTAFLSFANWQSSTGFDAAGSFSSSLPQGTEVFIRPDEYEAGRAVIIIYNHDLLDSVTLDLSNAGLADGQGFSIIPVEEIDPGNLTATEIYSALNPQHRLNMQPSFVNLPVGWNASTVLPSTRPFFGVFLLVPGTIVSNQVPVQDAGLQLFTLGENQFRVRCRLPMAAVQIFSPEGKLLQTLEADGLEKEISMTALSPGIYPAALHLRNGQSVTVKLPVR